MQNNLQTPKQSLNPALLKQKPDSKEIDIFKNEIAILLDGVTKNETESEEYHKNLMKDFLNNV
ncbi:MAG: hypothetical protein LBV75_01415, partial [Paludibacter sp.]|nr:hypothetical protein [Paludibacter sp.]